MVVLDINVVNAAMKKTTMTMKARKTMRLIVVYLNEMKLMVALILVEAVVVMVRERLSKDSVSIALMKLMLMMKIILMMSTTPGVVVERQEII